VSRLTPETRRGFVEQAVGAGECLGSVDTVSEHGARQGDKLCAVAATVSTDPTSDPASTMHGISITSAHQRPSARLRLWASGWVS